MKNYKSGDIFHVAGFDAIHVGINNVLVFNTVSICKSFEFWKDCNEVYHVGIVYKKDGEEFRYKHYLVGKEPKKYGTIIQAMRRIYDEYFPVIQFTNYDRKAAVK